MPHVTRLLPAVALLVLACAAPAAASEACDGLTPATAGPVVKPALFAYDRTLTLDVQVAGSKAVGAAVVQDITFSPRPDRPGERVAAYIVAPARPAASLAAVLWVHWLGEPATTNRTQFLDEATALAGRGVVSVLVDTMWARPRWYRDRVLEEDQAHYIAQVVALRRALDLLLAQPGADPARVALVGHDYGAMHAALLAGVDPRVKAYVMIAPTASLLDWAFFYDKAPVSMETYRQQHAVLSLCDHLATATQAAFLFQFAEQDRFVTLAKAEALFASAGGRKQMAVYSGAGHAMTAPAAIGLDRTAWLVRELSLTAPGTGFTLPDMTGLIEGIAFRPRTGAFYFGDVHHRCVWQRTADGTVTRFTAPDDRLLGVFRIEIDEARGVAWAAMSALPQMAGYAPEMKGRAGIAEIDLATGAVRRIGLVPSDGATHVIGDLLVLADGTLLATDSTAPVLWKWTPGQPQLEPLVRSELFASLQGIASAGDPAGVFLTDYRNGLIYVDRSSQMVRAVPGPPGANLRGLDTLVRAADGTLIAIQNGTAQQRVLRLTVSPGPTAVTQVDVVAADPAMADATLGSIVGSDFVFIADGGWNRFEPGKVNATPRGIPILSVPLSSSAGK